MRLLKISSIFTLLGILLATLLTSCTASINRDHSEYVEKNFEVEDFSKIKFEGAYNIKLTQGDEHSVVVKTSEQIHDRVRVWVDDDRLNFKTRGNNINSDEILVSITFKNIENIKIEGGAYLSTVGYIDVDDFEIDVEGGANIDIKIKADRISTHAAGGVNMEFQGVANEFSATSEGAGNIDADNLEAKYVKCKVSGVGNASVFATEKLIATVEGVGKIGYRGNPDIEKNVSGIGLVYRK
ncbi:MAG: DUF2807 domain-containing protein [Prolixibacteraceae bacterium]|nr:DUF2807 domain-containing protein [Prolixibacteraceae bacterium]